MSAANSKTERETPRDGQSDEEAVSDEDSGGSTPFNDEQNNMLPPDQQSRSAYYDYASQKLMSNAESKMLYQRHQMESAQNDGDMVTPLARARTMSSLKDGANVSLSRSVSAASRTSTKTYGVRQREKGRGYVPAQGKADEPSPDDQLAGFTDGENDMPLTDIPEQGPEVIDPNEGVGYATSGSGIMPELTSICTNIQKVLDTRRRYLELSLQNEDDDPRSDPHWELYPPPPLPVWDEENNRPIPQTSGSNSLANSSTLSPDDAPPSPSKKRRKAGRNIGEDFDINDLFPLPGDDSQTKFRLDQASVYQVYESAESMELKSRLTKSRACAAITKIW